MPTSPPQPNTSSAAAKLATGPAGEEIRRHDAWFTTTPDPWREIALLDYGEDRTYASIVRQQVVNADPAQRPALEKRLLDVLARPELTGAGRQFVCRMLGLIGSKACVPAVAGLLHDDRTADVARMALDPISGDEVNAAYRAALGKLNGAALMGLIGSIVAHGDAAASEALAKLAQDDAQSAPVRAAAERAVKQLARS